MRSNIDDTKRRIEEMEQTTHVDLDGDTSGAILRAMVEDGMDDFEDAIESLSGVDIKKVKGTPFGLEVTLR